jgi:probable rRNA maturation factor
MRRTAPTAMTRTLDFEVCVDAQAWITALPEAEELCRTAARAAWTAGPADVSVAEACVLLTDNDRSRALNRRYRGRDEPTNVLSFATGEATAGRTSMSRDVPVPLGDIVIAFEAAAKEAAEAQKAFGEHLQHLVVHGMLHLLGYDHETDAEAEVMERLESRILAGLGVPDPYVVDDGSR